MRLKFLLLLVFSICGTLTCNTVWADGVVVIQNASFESSNPLSSSCGSGCAFNFGPIPSWTITGAGGGGSFEPNSSFFNLPLPDGNIVAYSNGSTISQDLSVSVQANSTYNLSVFVGHRLDGLANTFSIALYDGSVALCSTPTSSNSGITAGSFADIFLTCTTGSSVAPGDLTVVLAGGGPQIQFDNVSLTVATPEPNTLLQLAMGLGLIVILSPSLRRRLT